MNKTYGDLYLFIEKKFASRTKRENIHGFVYTKRFLEKHHIPNPSRIIQILSDFGAASDLEVLWNAADKIPDNTNIEKDIETPIEYAIRNNYYCKWHEGMWVRCKKEDKGSMPDISTAYKRMEIFRTDD